MTLRMAAAAALICLGLSGAASAQQGSPFAGSWYCQHSMQPYSGNAYDLHYWEFQLYADPGGAWQAQGYYQNPVVGQVAVQGQGSYGYQPGFGEAQVVFDGTMARADAGPQRYQMPAIMADASQFYFQFRGNTHLININCQRSNY